MKKYTQIAISAVLGVVVIAVSITVFNIKQKPKNITAEASKANSAEITSTTDNKNNAEAKKDETVQETSNEEVKQGEQTAGTSTQQNSGTSSTSLTKQPESSQPKSQEPTTKPQPAKSTPTTPTNPTPQQTQPAQPSGNSATTANLQKLVNNYGFKSNGPNSAFYNSQVSYMATNADINVGTDLQSKVLIQIRNWIGRTPELSQDAFNVYLPTQGSKLYSMVNAYANNAGSQYLDKNYTMDGHNVYIHYYADIDMVQVEIHN